MIAKFIKKMPRFVGSLFAVLIVPFLLFPFYHFHPGDVHAHPQQIQTHTHKAHFHSEILENVAHLAHFHPSDPDRDQPLHQSHSLPEHDSDNWEINTQQFYPSVKADIALPDYDVLFSLGIPQATQQRHPFVLATPLFEPQNSSGAHSSRSPPSLQI